MPSSTSIIAATLVTGLVIDAIQKIELVFIGTCLGAILRADRLQVGELVVVRDGDHRAGQPPAPLSICAWYHGAIRSSRAGTKPVSSARAKEGFSTARNTMAIISTVGTSFHQR